MDAFFSQRCVTADSQADDASMWSTTGRSELTLVQEHRGASGASRAVLASVLAMVAECKKTARVLLLSLDALCVDPQVDSALADKLEVRDYSGDLSLFHNLLDESCASLLIPKLQHDVDAFSSRYATSSSRSSPTLSSRPLIVAIDALNVLLQSHSLVQVLLFLKKLRSNPLIGSVIVRIDASAEPQTTTQALADAATALVMVETRSSLAAYSVLAKERQREIPKAMDGFVQLVRLKKNARVSESIEFFRVKNSVVVYSDASTPSPKPPTPQQPSNSTSIPSEKPTQARTAQSAIPLPVPQGEVSFNLSISTEEQAAKSKVQLPYMHQGHQDATNGPASATTSGANLFFIDEDDPDWDDDDLDDDLDI